MKKILDSGAELDITMGSFKESHDLFKAVMLEIGEIDFATDEEVLNAIKNVFAKLISSQKVEDALWKCMLRATYDNKKIVQDLFEDEKIRADFLIVAKEVLVHNLTPFTASLKSLLSGLPEKIMSTLKLKLNSTKQSS